MAVKRQPGFEAKRVAGTETAGDHSEFLARFQNLVPHPGAGGFVAGNVDFESVFAGVAGASNQSIFQSANRPARHPIELHRREVRVGEFLQEVDRLRPLNRNLGKVVGEIFDRAIELAGMVAHPVEILFTCAGIDHQQVFIFSKAVNDHVIHESALRIKQRRILRLADGEPRSVIHRNVLDGGQRLRPGQPDVAHVADVKNADARSHRIVLGHDSARGRVFDGHLPAIEFDHFGAHPAMDRMERGLADGWRSRLDCGQ